MGSLLLYVMATFSAIAIALTPVAAIADSAASEDRSATLYADLNEAVVAEDWQRAIATIDRLIADDPVRASGLGGYRELLVARANATPSNVPPLPVLESELAEPGPTESDRETSSGRADSIAATRATVEPEANADPETNAEPETENPTANSDQRDRDIERRLVRAGDRVGRRYSREYREARFWLNLWQ
ncbi:MAG: hypothetical protein AAF704_17245 [Cyanobacteria bacterium P01_D01_bin.123]